MKTLPGTAQVQSDPFAPTHWSVIVAAGESQAAPEAAKAALAQLCETYWAPLYTFVRSRGYPLHDAQDLTQGFFAYLIEHKIYTRADRQKGRFRSFLLALPAYADLATRLGLVASSLRSHVTRLRARYREALRLEVRRTVETEAEVEAELRELLRVLTSD